MIRVELLERVSELRAARMAFVLATVVRVAKPASAHAGDAAILLPDGTLEGFVGGMCSESTVRTQGLRQLAAGRSVLLHITPPPAVSPAELGLPSLPGPRGAAESADTENEVTVGNPCLSGGALDIFLEVMRPPALVHLYGDTPVARALVAVGAAAGLDVRPTIDAGMTIPPDASAVDAGVPYVGLLASRRRGAALVEALGLDAEQLTRLHTPAGLNIGAQSPGEVALSIMAEIVAETRSTGPFHLMSPRAGGTPAPAGGPAEATDPMCEMTVAITESAIRAETPDGRVYFCSPGCRDAFLAELGR